ncbi:MAG: ABC transporter permease, partial [Gemmatimonadota bacterium]
MGSGWRSDLRYVLRVLGRSPGFVVVAVISLAVGIGANAAVFGMVQSLLREPLPVEAPDELAVLGWRRDADVDLWQSGSTWYDDPGGGGPYRSNFSFPVYEGLRAAAPDGVELFAFAFLRGISVGLPDASPLVAGGVLADGSYFPALEPRMALGRPLTEADDREGAPVVVVLGHRFWMRAFGGDPAIVGKTVRVNSVAAEVVGITEEGFRGMSQGGFFPETDVTVPLAAQGRIYDRIGSGTSPRSDPVLFWIRVMARIPEGISRDRTRDVLTAALRAQPSPVNEVAGPPAELALLPGARGAQPIRAQRARILWMILGVAWIVLLIACANLASLMLARGVSRQRDMAVRRALGGGRARLVRQCLLESLVLAGAGTVAGLVLAYLTRNMLGGMVSGSMGSGFGRVVVEGTVDPPVVVAAAMLGGFATVISGLLPALRASDTDPMTWLKHRAGGGSITRLTAGRVLLALQIGVSVPLVVGAALFLRTLSNIGGMELGFNPRNMVMFQVDPAYTQLPPEEHPRLYQELLSAVGGIPGVSSVTLMENVFMSGIISNSHVDVDGREHELLRNSVGPDFLETAGMRLISGRMPGIQDGPDAPRVGVVNERAVEVLYGGASPIGRMLDTGSREVEIIGVVSDSRYDHRRHGIRPTLFDAALQWVGHGAQHIVLRSSLPMGRLEPVLNEAVARVHPGLPVPEIRTQAGHLADASA